MSNTEHIVLNCTANEWPSKDWLTQVNCKGLALVLPPSWWNRLPDLPTMTLTFKTMGIDNPHIKRTVEWVAVSQDLFFPLMKFDSVLWIFRGTKHITDATLGWLCPGFRTTVFPQSAMPVRDTALTKNSSVFSPRLLPYPRLATFTLTSYPSLYMEHHGIPAWNVSVSTCVSNLKEQAR